MRPRLHPALAHIWRDAHTIQIGVTPAHAALFGGLGPAEAALVRAMDGGRTVDQLRTLAAANGSPPSAADHLVDELVDSGAVIDDEVVGTSLRAPDPEAATAALLSSAPDAGASLIATRRRRHVEVHGGGRVGAMIARLLVAAGIGEVSVDDPGEALTGDISPGGLERTDIGLPRGKAVEGRIRMAHGQVGRPASTPPDFVVFAPVAGVLPETGESLLRSGTPHLVASIIETTGVVGPLVVPGESACLRCVDLHRTSHDPAWPHVVNQCARQPPPTPACDVSLAAAVAGLAGSHIVAHLDGFAVASVGGAIELSLPTCLPRRRSWRPHPACGCTWDDEP